MNKDLHVQFAAARYGWLPVTIAAGEQRVTFTASYTPVDSLARLIVSLVGVLTTQGTTNVTWFTEPVEYAFVFVADADGATFTIVEFPDHRRPADGGKTVLTFHGGDRHTLVLPFWRALRRLQTHDGFEHGWQRPFPHEAMSHLSRLISMSRSA